MFAESLNPVECIADDCGAWSMALRVSGTGWPLEVVGEFVTLPARAS